MTDQPSGRPVASKVGGRGSETHRDTLSVERVPSISSEIRIDSCTRCGHAVQPTALYVSIRIRAYTNASPHAALPHAVAAAQPRCDPSGGALRAAPASAREPPTPKWGPDAMLTAVISGLSESSPLLHESDSNFPNLLVQCICCWTRQSIGVRASDKVLRTVANVLELTTCFRVGNR